MEKIAKHIVTWLNAYCEKSGMNGFVIGVSGGIDSAVTSTLCARTGKAVVALEMPIHQAADQVTRASAHIAWLEKHYANVSGCRIDLTPLFDQMRATLPREIQDDLTMANTRSRLRMVTLYAQAGNRRMLVAGTGNRVEDFGVGFFTKYGDGGVDLSPIADLMKSEVYALGRHLGIHRDILNAAPTDGLWEDGRTDESQIGATYEELEWAMAFEAAPKDSSLLSIRERQVVAIYRRFHDANQHKMVPVPVCQIPDTLR